MPSKHEIPPTNLPDNIPPYTPMSSLGHELGILFGFLVACFVIMGVYIVVWRVIERREEHREKVRREELTAKGIHHGRGGVHEKMMDRDRIAPFERAELPGYFGGVGTAPRVVLGAGGATAAGSSSRAHNNMSASQLRRGSEREVEMESLRMALR
ncbi:uncharacterized protein KD926_009238 [Aspergillus affinis]|uniref:uncharacterized protein n=1 Tax=Aspergillus affinis TaxID=1070780 RepID=UPI0022FECD68|nr:uncharacterized protein KD926_009238 [Aspergillus affinis]KAI9039645.1 hypothetical protein KD926_009238 [Aspergillus affinis]